MNNTSKVIKLLKILKKIYICEMAGFNETKHLIQNIKIDDLNSILEENGVKLLKLLESCYEVEEALQDNILENGCERTKESVKKYFHDVEGIKLSDNEVNDIYEKYIKGK